MVYSDTIASQWKLFCTENSMWNLTWWWWPKYNFCPYWWWIKFRFNTEFFFKSDKQKWVTHGTIVFRGSVTANDWIQNFQANVTPIQGLLFTHDRDGPNLRHFQKDMEGFTLLTSLENRCWRGRKDHCLKWGNNGSLQTFDICDGS